MNVELKKTQPYSLNVVGSNKTGQDYKRVSKGVTTPASGKVNLGFASLLVKDTLSAGIGNVLPTTFSSVLVSNALVYTYTNPQTQKRQGTRAHINVKSSNSEYEITLGLTGNTSPTVNVFYPNVQQQSQIDFDENDVWS
jgi:hypothetical protein